MNGQVSTLLCEGEIERVIRGIFRPIQEGAIGPITDPLPATSPAQPPLFRLAPP
ncbi:hypothetical protein M747DRAFT_136040 [Aspergillus niger ATCC 13496]|uniref:Uncharacterized protein n=1 Tax=Aspergillus niger ATCC 13496 TaxID=1353008 RepID=A0A370CA26_ASPNG|nr:hypothetical protein M747DRAFT_136040 [Aspergillus niger ATCC 13496]